MDKQKLFDEDFLKKLARLKYLAQKTLLSGTGGEKSLRQKGGRLEFSDYRKYSPGDEARYIDWNIFGRTEKLFVKEFAREESLPVYLLLDTTASMNPDIIGAGRNKIRETKFKYAARLAAALVYIGLITRNPVRLFGFFNRTLKNSPPFSGENRIFEALKFLESLTPAGETHLASILTALNKQIKKKGLLIVISDLMDYPDIIRTGRFEEETFAEAAQKIFEFTRRGFSVSVFHLLSREEEQPVLFNQPGRVKLKDSETGATKTVLINKKMQTLYRQSLNSFMEEWHSFCLQHGIKYFRVDTTGPLETLILKFLREGGLLK